MNNSETLLTSMVKVTKEMAGDLKATNLNDLLTNEIFNLEMFGLMPDVFQVDVVNKILINKLRSVDGSLSIREWLVSTDTKSEYIEIYKEHWMNQIISLGVI